MYGKNYRELGRSVVTEEKKIVFISYRNRYPDAEWAEECADIVRKTYGLDIWFDKKDACLPSGSPAPEIARCVEEGLDVASALLGVISPQTFTSPWPPYEIGGARGRQRFVEPFQDWSGRFPEQSPNPLIAHLVTSGDNPEFISLVVCHIYIAGYNLLSLMRASSVVNCHFTVADCSFLRVCHFWISCFKVSWSAILLERHCRDSTESSISAMFSQLPCLGV